MRNENKDSWFANISNNQQLNRWKKWTNKPEINAYLTITSTNFDGLVGVGVCLWLWRIVWEKSCECILRQATNSSEFGSVKKALWKIENRNIYMWNLPTHQDHIVNRSHVKTSARKNHNVKRSVWDKWSKTIKWKLYSLKVNWYTWKTHHFKTRTQ